MAMAVAEGATNKQVAAGLFLSPKTIDFHLGRVYRKLGIHSRTELAALVAKGALGDPPDGPSGELEPPPRELMPAARRLPPRCSSRRG